MRESRIPQNRPTDRWPSLAQLPTRDQSAAIREWAKGAGFEISARGRISTEVRPSLRKGRLKWIANGFGRILPKRIDNAF